MKYPTATPRPETVSFGRVSYTDSFRWLEEESQDSLDYQAQQNRLTQDWLTNLPVRARAAARLDAMPRIEVPSPIIAGGRWFRLHTPEGENLQVVELGESFDGPWRRVIDLNQQSKDEPRAIYTILPSPDGSRLLYIWGAGGREYENLSVMEVDSGKILVESIPQVRPLFPTWISDSSGFYIGANAPDSGTQMRVYRHHIGAPSAIQPDKYEPTHPVGWVKPGGDGRHALLMAEYLNAHPDYIRDEAANGAWRPFLKGFTSAFRGGIVGDRYYAITDDGAPCGRLVSIPLATPQDRSTWRELIPGSSDVMMTVRVVDGHIVLADLVDTWSRLRVFDLDGQLKREITLPGRGSFSAALAAPVGATDVFGAMGGSEIMFQFSAPTQSPSLYKADIHTGKVEALTEPSLRFEATVLDRAATSADGARVPYQIVALAGSDLSQPRPTVLYGYGGFNIPLLPAWISVFLATWVQAGGLLVLAHLRGGGELGPRMWQEGRLRHKQNSFNDVHAVAQHLHAAGVTTPAQLGVIGASNGGVMAAAVAVQRPELYRACISGVPLTDILGRARDPVTVISTLDYGDPNDPEMSEVLLSWSPYQNVEDGANYPALLFSSGKNDPRCPPWHVRKMSARMQQANAGPHPILMRVRDNYGHGAVGAGVAREQDVDFLGFFADQLGLAL